MDKKKQPDNYRHQPRRTTAYALEALEARILLAADVAAAVQINQEQAVATPQPAAVTVLSAQADAQQTLSVADLLVREASSFATMGQQPTSMSSVVTSSTDIIPQQTQTVSDLLTRDPSLFNSLINHRQPHLLSRRQTSVDCFLICRHLHPIPPLSKVLLWNSGNGAAF